MELKGNEIHRFLSIIDIPLDDTIDTIPESNEGDGETQSVVLEANAMTDFGKEINKLYESEKIEEIFKLTEKYKKSKKYIINIEQLDIQYAQLVKAFISSIKLNFESVENTVKNIFDTEISTFLT
ncbi:hypothetical protein ES708_33731 [subsurface metagenome]